VRLAVYTDYRYRSDGDRVYAERAFAAFVSELAGHFRELIVTGRLHPEPGRSHYLLPEEVGFVPLPHYGSLTRPATASRAVLRSLVAFWHLLGAVDSVWLLGPQGLALPFALLAAGRRKQITLGVRQDLPEYVGRRWPGRLWIHAAARLLEAAFRGLARWYPVVVVGPQLAHNYRSSRQMLVTVVSLVDEDQIVSETAAHTRTYDGELRLLAVGRLEKEKNPLMLADVLAQLRRIDSRWRLVVCGEGPMAGELSDRLVALGLEEHVHLRGYVPLGRELWSLYRESHAFLHVSWTEGLPQVLFEAFAAGLPTVATAVGGVPSFVRGAALLVEPGDPAAAAEQVAMLGRDEVVRVRLVDAGLALVRQHTTQREVLRLARFLRGQTQVRDG
jgi:glycosyltransferase involved in cell wall biosynthesis